MSKRVFVTLVAAVTLGLAGSVLAAPGTTANMSVTANVETSCTIGSVDTLAFGAYGGGALNGTAVIKVTCVAADGSASLSLDDGLHALAGSPGTRQMLFTDLSSNPHFLAYSLNVTDGSGACWGGVNVCSSPHSEPVTQDGTEQDFTVYGTIPGAQSLYAGNYSDTVLVSVTF